jgi:hypothetical protein
VGCWCPWSPNPEEVQEQEFAETQLNTMMKHYKDNQVRKDIFYEERKRELQFMKVKKELDEEDNWMKNKETGEASGSSSTAQGQEEHETEASTSGSTTTITEIVD